MDLRWSTPRRLALEAFFINRGRARRSNSTDASRSLAYWQSVDWLEAAGLVERAGPRAGPDEYRLTKAGWDAGGALWNLTAETLKRMRLEAS